MFAESALYRLERHARLFSERCERTRVARQFDVRLPETADLRHIRVAAAVKAVCPHFDALIDVGAHKGRFAEVLCSFWRFEEVICVEPNEALHPEIAISLAGNAKTLPVALGSRPSDATFFIHPDRSMSSLKPIEEGAFRRKFPFYRADDIVVRRVPVQTLDWVISTVERQPLRKILLKLDAQGSELEILRSGGDRFSQIGACIVEHMFWGGYKAVPDLHDLVEFMRQSGFACRGVLDLTYRATGESACADFLFVRIDARELHR